MIKAIIQAVRRQIERYKFFEGLPDSVKDELFGEKPTTIKEWRTEFRNFSRKFEALWQSRSPQ